MENKKTPASKARQPKSERQAQDKNMAAWSALLAIIIIALLIGIVKWRDDGSGAPWKTYSNLLYHVSLDYPAGWGQDKDNEDRYQGLTGFFQVGLISGEGMDIDAVTRDEAFHQLKPYGSQPMVRQLQVAGYDARLIIPGSDQPKEMHEQTAVIMRLPQPLIISQSTYNYFILWADKKNIDEIASTLSFQGLTAPVDGTEEEEGEGITFGEPYPSDEDSEASSVVEAKVVEEGTSSGQETAENRMVSDEKAWEELWQSLHGDASPDEQPLVNFEKEMVVAIFLGSRPTGGYAVSVTRVLETDTAVEVSSEETQPGESCLVAQAITTPYTVVILPKNERPLTYMSKTNVRECASE